MNLNEMKMCFQNLNLETEYQHVDNCPAEPIKSHSSSRTFLGETSCNSNVIGKDDNRVLKTLCFNNRK